MVDKIPRVLYRVGMGPNPRTIKQLNRSRSDVLRERGDLAAASWRVMEAWAVRTSKALSALAALVAVVAIWRRPNFERCVQSSFWVPLVTLLFTSYFWPWYVTWPLALAALLEWRPSGQLTVIFSGTALMIYSPILWQARQLVVFLPVLAMLAFYIWQKRGLMLGQSQQTYHEMGPKKDAKRPA